MTGAVQRDRSQRRRRVLTFAALLLLLGAAAAAEAIGSRGEAWRLIDWVRVGALMLLALVIALRSTTSFSLLRRDSALDDELARANRASAAAWGFWTLLAALIAAFAVNAAVPLQVMEMAPAIVVLGAAAAGLRFVWLERQGE